jgi:hypothetical protein
MKRSFYWKLVSTTLLTILAFYVLQQEVVAQDATANLLLSQSFGVAPTQSVRFTLFNPDGTPIRAKVKLHDKRGAVVAYSDESIIQPNAFHSFGFEPADIHLSGEPATGRRQLRASAVILSPNAIGRITAILEIVESAKGLTSGLSSTFLVGERLPSSETEDRGFLSSSRSNDIVAGIVPGQSIRVTLFNAPFESQTQTDTVGGRIKIFDGSNNLIVQSDEMAIAPGSFRSIDFNAEDLAIQGEPGTNRKQVRIGPFFEFQGRRLSRVVVSIETVDNLTGQTTVLSGQECLVFFLGGIPE